MKIPKISLVTILFVVILCLLVLVFSITYFSYGPQRQSLFRSSTAELSEKSGLYLGGSFVDNPTNVQRKRVKLFFLGEDETTLVVETRELFTRSDEVSEIRETLLELFWGSKNNLRSAIPPQTRLREVYLDHNQTVYIDLTREFIDNHPGGVLDEIATLVSIIRTVRENFPDIERVQILVDGNEVETLANHIQINRPLTGNEFQKVF